MSKNKARSELGYSPKRWTSEDGHNHVSIPTKEPIGWDRTYEGLKISYVSHEGGYTIRREPYGRTRYTYTVYRDREELPLAFYSRLVDAKARAVKNALGQDRINVA